MQYLDKINRYKTRKKTFEILVNENKNKKKTNRPTDERLNASSHITKSILTD